MFSYLDNNDFLKPQTQPWLERKTKDYSSSLIHLNPKSVKASAMVSQFRFTNKNDSLEIYPDSCPKILISLDSEKPKAFLLGARDNVGRLAINTDSELFLASLYSFYGTKNWKIETAESFNQIIELKDAMNDTSLLQDNLFSAPTLEEKIETFKDFYRDFMTDYNYDIGIAEHTALYLNTHYEMLNIPDLVDSLGYSRRHIENKFKEINGISPKKYNNIFRFQRALNLMLTEDLSNADIAQKTGYFDESHLIKDFNTYTHLSPKKLATIY